MKSLSEIALHDFDEQAQLRQINILTVQYLNHQSGPTNGSDLPEVQENKIMDSSTNE